jgi:4-hydroxybenzoate polyprenyltransferase
VGLPALSPTRRALALGRLLRLSLAPTALADVAAGTVLGAKSWPDGPAPFALLLASACVYHGAMALNDWADRAEDARTRPGRPIPSGTIAPRLALALAAVLLSAGPCLALAVAPRGGLLLAGVAACAALYDLAGRGPWLGPLLLAGCRAGNLGVGIVGASAPGTFDPWLALAPLGYGLYVFLVSRLARLEDLDAGSAALRGFRPTRWLAAAGAALLCIGVVGTLLALGPLAPQPSGWRGHEWSPLVLAGAGALGLFRAAHAPSGSAWSARDVQRATGMALRRLLVASAALAAGASPPAGLLVALAILCGYPLSFALRRVFPPT